MIFRRISNSIIEKLKIRKKYGELMMPLGILTYVAEKDGEIVGLISLQDTENSVVVGPLYADTSFICLKLVEMMEITLQSMGIERYWFSVHEDLKTWDRAVSKTPDTRYLKTENHHKWYERKMVH